MSVPKKYLQNDKDYKPVTPEHIGKMVWVADHDSVWYRHELAAILPEPDADGRRYVVMQNGLYNLWIMARAEPDVVTAREAYIKGQEASGLKAGDWVRVTRKAASHEGGWGALWNPHMDHLVGSYGQIKDMEELPGVGVNLLGWNFPYFVLEKVTSRPASESDVGKVVQVEGVITHDIDRKLLAIVETELGGKKAVLQSIDRAGVFFAKLDQCSVELEA